jgi:uncharacterized protein YxeA
MNFSPSKLLINILLVSSGVGLGLYVLNFIEQQRQESYANQHGKDTKDTKDTEDTEDTEAAIRVYDQDQEGAEFLFEKSALESNESIDDLRESNIPNIIWTFWEGPKNPVVQLCIDSWKHYNPGYEVIVLSKSNYMRYTDGSVDVDTLPHSGDFVARYADYVRCLVLAHNGGFWIDSSVICHHPFTWVHAAQQSTEAEFIGYYIHTGTHPEFLSYSPMVENWFFACVPESPFMQDWCREFVRTRDFSTISDYLANVKAHGTHFNKIDSIGGGEYLTMHIAAQKILQDHRATSSSNMSSSSTLENFAPSSSSHTSSYNLCFFSACAGPFSYLHRNGWNIPTAVNDLVQENTRHMYYDCPLIKLRGSERSTMEKYDVSQQQQAFSHLK